jgi:23S rRNA pseudouridine1911/1915/1917 synthase
VSRYAELLDVLHEDNHLIAVNKPAGWPSAHAADGEDTVDRLVKAYLKEKYGKPGQVFLGIVHRLDKPTSGVLLFARTSKAAARLSEQFREGAVVKRYWAIISTNPADESSWTWQTAGSLDDWLLHDDAAERVRLARPGEPGAKPARLLYEVQATADGMHRLELTPHTGRKHQIRVQLASRGFPILGDVKYGSTVRYGMFIALHARSLTVLHPISKGPLTLTADVPPAWRGRFARVLPPGPHRTA